MTSKTITTFEVSNAPNIPALVFRRYLGEQDIPGIANVSNAANKADQIEEYDSIEHVTNRYKTLRNTDMEKDIFIATVDNEIIGVGRTTWDEFKDENMYVYDHFFTVHPDWRGKGIGRAIQPVLEARCIEISKQHSAETQKMFQTWSGEKEKSKNKLIERFGFSQVRYFFDMRRDLSEPIPEAPLPEGLEIRPVTPKQYEEIYYGMDEAFKDHWGYSTPNAEDFARWKTRVETMPDYAPKNWVVVWDGDQMAGILLTGVHEESNQALGLKIGWMHVIGVRRPWRKRGLASAMMVEGMHKYKALGLDFAALGVDTDNPSGALGLYERHGFKQTDKWITWRKAFPSQ